MRRRLSLLFYGEGSDEKHLLYKLTELEQFIFHTKKWTCSIESARGGSPKDILNSCMKFKQNRDYDKTICFIDLDVFKGKRVEYYKNYYKRKYPNIEIFWQENNLEDELKRNLKITRRMSKAEINKFAREHVKKLVNTKYWKKLISLINEQD